MYTVYAIYNGDADKIYIGQTEDLEERLIAHNNHEFKSSNTARFKGDWKLIYKEKVSTRSEAIRREKQLKSFRGREFIKTHIPE